jgi:hypothetical protein
MGDPSRPETGRQSGRVGSNRKATVGQFANRTCAKGLLLAEDSVHK